MAAARRVAALPRALLDAPPPGARGGIFDRRWLELAAKTHDPHMGAENLGPSLYALVRFVKPKTVLEIGAGYTSLFLLQALRDNDEELAFLRREKRADREAGHLGIADEGGQKPMAGMPRDAAWFAAAETRRLLRSPSVLHCVDDLSHAFCTAREIKKTAERLGVEKHLEMYDGDAWAGAPPACRPKLSTGTKKKKDGAPSAVAGPVDMLWVDFGVGDRLDAFLRLYWPSVAPGGFVVVHSTVTNRATRAWLERVRRGEFAWLEPSADGGEGNEKKDDAERTARGKREKDRSETRPESARSSAVTDEVHHVSFLEPHKRYQNAFTVLQKRPRGWGEPVYTDEA